MTQAVEQEKMPYEKALAIARKKQGTVICRLPREGEGDHKSYFVWLSGMRHVWIHSQSQWCNIHWSMPHEKSPHMEYAEYTLEVPNEEPPKLHLVDYDWIEAASIMRSYRRTLRGSDNKLYRINDGIVQKWVETAQAWEPAGMPLIVFTKLHFNELPQPI
jgi:hypothetical protein